MASKVEKIPDVTEEQWQSINKENRVRVEEFLRESMQLSPKTLEQYRSALRIYFWYVKENCGDKRYDEIKPRDYLSYQNFLIRRGLSSSAVRLKRSVVSSFNQWLETYYQDELPVSFRNYVTKKIPAPEKNLVNEKQPLTLEEYEHLCNVLEEKEMWQILAYVKFSFSTGARRAEVIQLKKEVVTYEPKVREMEVKDEEGNVQKKVSKSYLTHEIRCKGKGVTGKVRKLQFDSDAMQAIKKWLEIRGDDDCEYVFVSKDKNTIRQIALETANSWCDKYLEPIVGRRVHPHLLRSSRVTSMITQQGKDITVAQKLLGHESSETTRIYLVKDDTDVSDEAFVD